MPVLSALLRSARRPFPGTGPGRTRGRRVAVSLAALFVAVPFALGAAAPADAQTSTVPDAGALRPAVADAALDRAHLTPSRLAADSRRSQVAVEHRAADGRWAFGTVVLTAPPEEHGAPQGWLYLAEADAGTWDIALEGTDAFRSMVRQSPRDLLRPDERRILGHFGDRRSGVQASEEGAANTGMTLPWAVGQSWVFTGGPHPFGVGGSGPLSSMDFSGGDGIVRAARGGTAYAMCASGGYRGWIRIYHDNGLSSDYYHLTNNIQPHGAPVAAGTPLGYIGNDVSCGGASSGAHVHFSLLSGDTYIPVHGAVIGGWLFQNGSAPYQGTAYDGSTVVGVGGYLYNYGPS